MPIRELSDGLWVIDHEFSMTGGIQMGLRTSIVRLSEGGLWIHSPGPLSEGERADIRALGPVSAIVAPNLFHYFSLLDATRAFPEAQLFVAAGLAEKLGTLPECQELGSEAPALWAGQIEQIVVDGAPRLGEVLFLINDDPPRSR